MPSRGHYGLYQVNKSMRACMVGHGERPHSEEGNLVG